MPCRRGLPHGNPCHERNGDLPDSNVPHIALHRLPSTCPEQNLSEGQHGRKKLKELSDIVAIELALLDMRIKGLLPTANTVLASPAKKFRWTGKVVDLVELLYALDTCDCIDNGEIGVEELADAFSASSA